MTYWYYSFCKLNNKGLTSGSGIMKCEGNSFNIVEFFKKNNIKETYINSAIEIDEEQYLEINELIDKEK